MNFLGVHHSFDNDSSYTFRKTRKDQFNNFSIRTDNVMDYYADSTINFSKLIWKWQYEKILLTNNNSIIRHEKDN